MVGVFNHKTNSSHGSANIIMTPLIHRLTNCYVDKFRPRPLEQCRNLVFLTSSVGHISHLSQDLKELSRQVTGKKITVTVTDMRKKTCTMAGMTQDDAVSRKVAKHMTHSHTVAQSHYCQLEGVATSLEAYELINRREKRPAPEQPILQPIAKKPRRLWQDGEVRMLTEHFSLISQSSPPILYECRQFLETAFPNCLPLFEGRKADEIKDKCRTIIRGLQRGN